MISLTADSIHALVTGQAGYGIVSFTLDAAGRVSVKQDQNGDTVTYNYDLAGRLTSRDYRTAANSPTGPIADSDAFTYDPAGRMLSAASGRYGNSVGYTYDAAGRKATESLTVGGQTYTATAAYDAKGQLTGLTYPSGVLVQRQYSARGELTAVLRAGTTLATRSYDNGGRMVSSAYNNGVSESRTYNADNTLASIQFTGAAIGDMTYQWDANKNKTAESISGVMSGYGFFHFTGRRARRVCLLSHARRNVFNAPQIPAGGYDSEDRLVQYADRREFRPVVELVAGRGLEQRDDRVGGAEPHARPGARDSDDRRPGCSS
ncbi:MAG: hypothetical protein KatS3mg111_4017 [Pirellulaceae bacterium]|nr:MAG: hypothetical protein KatS3mg111_4017 [Pirellulaceae bacterium]